MVEVGGQASGTRTLEVAVVTPEGAAFEGTAKHVVAPGFDGEIAFYPLHAPFVGLLGVGELRVQPAEAGAKLRRFLLSGGVVHVHDDRVSVLAEYVTPVEQLDIQAMRERMAGLEGELVAGDEAISARFRQLEEARAAIRLATKD